MFKGWRARIHYLTRSRSFLLKTSAVIVGAGFLLACLIASLKETPISKYPEKDPMEQGVRQGLYRLRSPGNPRPHELARWIFNVVNQGGHLAKIMKKPEPTIDSFLKTGRLLVFNVRNLIQQHAADAEVGGMFEDYVIALLDPGDERGAAAVDRLHDAGNAQPPRRYANEFYGLVMLHQQRKQAALDALVREGAFEDAASARELSMRLALELRDIDLLKELAARPQWVESIPPAVQHRIGALIGDWWLQLRGMLLHQLKNSRFSLMFIALSAAGIWYVIFVQRSPPARWRWARPVWAVMAGVVSVWPTLAVLTYQETGLGMSDDAPFPYDLWYWVAGVGLREELCKLALFALFLPWLLWRRNSGLALMTGALVGLGFALEENVSSYYDPYGAAVWPRFLSANFLHAAWTGIAGLALYEMLRSRFAHAERFVLTFFAVVCAHGIYDYAQTLDLGLGSFDIVSIVILAGVAQFFFQLLAEHTHPSAGPVSPAAIFLIGSALLVAAMFIMAACGPPGLPGNQAIAAVGNECVAIAPMALIYWRQFDVSR